MKIVKDGTYKINGKRGQGGGTSILLLSGTAGGAVTTLGYYDDYGDFIDLVDGIVVVGSQTQIDNGFNVPIYLSVKATTGTTAISMLVNGKS